MICDPSWYRRLNRRMGWTKGTGNAIYANRKDMSMEDQSVGRKQNSQAGIFVASQFNTKTEEGQQKKKTRNESNLNQAEEFSEEINKLAEPNRLASKYLTPNEVANIVSTTCLCCQQKGDNSPIDIALEELHKRSS